MEYDGAWRYALCFIKNYDVNNVPCDENHFLYFHGYPFISLYLYSILETNKYLAYTMRSIIFLSSTDSEYT